LPELKFKHDPITKNDNYEKNCYYPYAFSAGSSFIIATGNPVHHSF
jgi:hypothetical protein